MPLAAGTAVLPASAENLTPAEKVMEASNNMALGYIQTGNPTVDRMTEAGLDGLGMYIFTHSNGYNVTVSGGGVAGTAPMRAMGLDLSKDDLSPYPVIMWAVDPAQQDFKPEEISKLNDYMLHGGLLFIDTRDGLVANGRGAQKVRRQVANGLQVPGLMRGDTCDKDPCHLMGRTFYLLKDFPGRYQGVDVWAERTSEYSNDGVATVIIGSSDWAAAWAMDGRGAPLVSLPDDRSGDQRNHAYRFGLNIFMLATTGSYKQDQVHTPEILERMGVHR